MNPETRLCQAAWTVESAAAPLECMVQVQTSPADPGPETRWRKYGIGLPYTDTPSDQRRRANYMRAHGKVLQSRGTRDNAATRELMAVATWVETSTTGAQSTGTAHAALVLNIPAGKRLARGVIWGQAGGVNSSNTGCASVTGFYLSQTLTLTGGGYGTKEIYHARPCCN